MALGYQAIRAQAGVPGLDKVYGVAEGRARPTSRPRRACRTETVWSTEKYLDHAPKLFEALRENFGFGFHLLHDVHHRLTPIEAARLGKSLEPFRLFWIEDPTPAENQEAFRLIRQHTVTPIAVGEVFNSIWDCKELIENQLIDYIRATVVHAGGITHLRKIAALAELYQVRTGCHGATDLSPVCMGAALHFDIAVPNFGIQEHMRHTAETDAVFPHAYTFQDGFMLSGRRARPRRRDRREARGAISLRAGLSAGRAARGRHADELVAVVPAKRRHLIRRSAEPGPMNTRPCDSAAPVVMGPRLRGDDDGDHNPYIPHGSPKCSRASPGAEIRKLRRRVPAIHRDVVEIALQPVALAGGRRARGVEHQLHRLARHAAGVLDHAPQPHVLFRADRPAGLGPARAIFRVHVAALEHQRFGRIGQRQRLAERALEIGVLDSAGSAASTASCGCG